MQSVGAERGKNGVAVSTMPQVQFMDEPQPPQLNTQNADEVVGMDVVKGSMTMVDDGGAGADGGSDGVGGGSGDAHVMMEDDDHGIGGEDEEEDEDDEGEEDEFSRAREFILLVRRRFEEEADASTYRAFLKLLHDFQQEECTSVVVLERVLVLFNGHPDLIHAFIHFLPPGVQSEARRRVDRARREQELRPLMGYSSHKHTSTHRHPSGPQSSRCWKWGGMQLDVRSKLLGSEGSSHEVGMAPLTHVDASGVVRQLPVERPITPMSAFMPSSSSPDAGFITSTMPSATHADTHTHTTHLHPTPTSLGPPVAKAVTHTHVHTRTDTYMCGGVGSGPVE